MTYRKDFSLPAELLEGVNKQGFDILLELIRVIINAAMQAEGLPGTEQVTLTLRTWR
jgi:hypothetical protein